MTKSTTLMKRRTFLKFSSVGAACALPGLGSGMLQRPKPLTEDLELVEVELFGKRWPVPVRRVIHEDRLNFYPLGDLKFNIGLRTPLPDHLKIYIDKLFPELPWDYVTTPLPFVGLFEPGDTLTLTWSNNPAGILEVG